MPATNQTPNYELPIFIGTDKPSWMGDWNGAMNKIDAALGEVKGLVQAAQTTANAASTTAQAAQTSVGALDTKVTSLETEQTSLQQSLMSVNEAVQDLQQQVDNLPTSLINTPVKYKRIGSNGALSATFEGNFIQLNGPSLDIVFGTLTIQSAATIPSNLLQIMVIQGNPFNRNENTPAYVGMLFSPFSACYPLLAIYSSSRNQTAIAVKDATTLGGPKVIRWGGAVMGITANWQTSYMDSVLWADSF